jgi:glycosyltransferase involved in cell wall biosynthesis
VRVLFLAHAYPRFAGDPVGSFIANLAVALRDEGVEVIVSAPAALDAPSRDTIDGIRVERFRYAPRSMETLAYTGTMGAQVKESMRGKLAMGLYLAAALRAARALARRERVGLVHAHWWFPSGLVASLLHSAGGPPFVVTSHGSDLRLARSFPGGVRLFRHVMARAAAMTAVSSWLAREAEQLVPGLTVPVMPMPVLGDLFHAGDSRDDDRLLFVGKLSEQKGLGRLLTALTLMTTRPRLTVVGAGRMDDSALRERARTLGVDERIEWLPILSQRELAEQYRRAAVHVIPALDEGLGLTAVEALLSETPVVGFASGGIPDIVRDGVSGRLVPPADERALALALDELMLDGERRHRLGVEGRLHAERTFGLHAVARGYADLYHRALASQRAPGHF